MVGKKDVDESSKLVSLVVYDLIKNDFNRLSCLFRSAKKSQLLQQFENLHKLGKLRLR